MDVMIKATAGCYQEEETEKYTQAHNVLQGKGCIHS